MTKNIEAEPAQKGEDKQPDSNIAGMNRRSFLKSAALGATALVGTGLITSCAPKSASSEDASAQSGSSISWDREVDLVVVGSGTGLAAAFTGLEEGLEVLVVEAQAMTGGCSGCSGGMAWAPCNSVMKERGIDDSREEALQYLKAGGEAFGEANEAIMEALVDNVNDAINQVAKSCEFEWRAYDKGVYPDYYMSFPGAKLDGRALVPDHHETGLLGKHFTHGIEVTGLEVMTSTPAKRIITRISEDGITPEVLGVEVERKGKAYTIKARKGVVMATGGFEWNEEMCEHYLNTPALYTWGPAINFGDGIKMAQAIGADLAMMNSAWGSPCYKAPCEEARKNDQASPKVMGAVIDQHKRGMVYINKHGKRFCDESASYPAVGRSFGATDSFDPPSGWQNLPAWAVFDNKSIGKFGTGEGGEAGVVPDYFVQADTLDEIADKLDGLLDKNAFLETIERFNKYAIDGLDPDFHRGESPFDYSYAVFDKDLEGAFRCLAPLDEPPYYAAELSSAVLGTCGGIRVNEKAQAIHVNGEVIPRLYACGNTAGIGSGSPMYTSGGGTIGPGLTFGYIAAKDIANLENWA